MTNGQKHFMKILLSFLLMGAMQITSAQEADVRKAVTDFFDAFHAQDSVRMRAAFHKDIVLHTVSAKAGKTKVDIETAKDMLVGIVGIPADVKFEEKLLSFQIAIDGEMAHVWTPYEFYINGKFSHKGVDSFTLVKEDGAWKILYLVDTRRK